MDSIHSTSPFRTVMTGITAMFLATSYRLLPNIISDYAYVDRTSELNNHQYYTTFTPEEYDFIVVGSGSSGSLVANRLSRNYKTLLLEAGGNPFPLQNVPALAPLMIGHKDLDWRYSTVPQTFSCMSHTNRSSYWPSGKGMGGTSLLNMLVWNRGSPLDYDNWAKMTGDKRWSYDELLPFFKRTERYLGRGNDFSEIYHGYKGEIPVSPVSFKPLVKYFLGAAQELGYQIKDLNAPYDEAFNEHCFNNYNGERRSAYHAFIQPIEQEWNSALRIKKYATVTKVLIQHHAPHRTYGVEYVQGGRLYSAISRQEVILSAGVVGSPKLLLLSGIGNAKHLEQIGVKPLVDLPGVGQNLMDHVAAMVGPFSLEHHPEYLGHLTYLARRDSGPSNVIDFLANGRGPLTQSGSMASGFISSEKLDHHIHLINETGNGKVWPDIHLLLIGIPQDSDGLDTMTRMFNLDPNIAKEYYAPVINQDSFSIMVSASRPKSRGYIQLASNDPFDNPIIDPNYYSHHDDMRITKKAILKTLELVEKTKAFSRIGASLVPNPFPSCKHVEYRSDDYWECFAKEYSISVHHPSGTCAMGKVNDPNSVVDSSLRVKGVLGLRVIDASVMPQIVTSDINAACTVIAERGAQIILDEYLKSSSPNSQ